MSLLQERAIAALNEPIVPESERRFYQSEFVDDDGNVTMRRAIKAPDGSIELVTRKVIFHMDAIIRTEKQMYKDGRSHEDRLNFLHNVEYGFVSRFNEFVGRRDWAFIERELTKRGFKVFGTGDPNEKRD